VAACRATGQEAIPRRIRQGKDKAVRTDGAGGLGLLELKAEIGMQPAAKRPHIREPGTAVKGGCRVAFVGLDAHAAKRQGARGRIIGDELVHSQRRRGHGGEAGAGGNAAGDVLTGCLQRHTVEQGGASDTSEDRWRWGCVCREARLVVALQVVGDCPLISRRRRRGYTLLSGAALAGEDQGAGTASVTVYREIA